MHFVRPRYFIVYSLACDDRVDNESIVTTKTVPIISKLAATHKVMKSEISKTDKTFYYYS